MQHEPSTPGASWWSVVTQSRSWHGDEWSLFNQNWSAQLAPATAQLLPVILSSRPYIHGDVDRQLARGLPRLDRLATQDVRWLNHH